MIAIVDYGVGNLTSIQNMLKKVGARAMIASAAEEISHATKLILPGVGSFDYAMERLRQHGLLDALNERVLRDRVPVLGICLGVQLLTGRSDEGREAGLGWIRGETVAFDRSRLGATDRVPFMGWADVEVCRPSRLTADLPADPRFYFVHSYHVRCEEEQDVVATSTHGYAFPAVVEHDNVVGVQFHPEKSHRFGMIVLRNFAECY
jgi:glutamine amidotransferase